MAKFSYVNKEKQLVEFSFNDIKPENPINDFIQNNSVDDSYDFDELTTNGIYLFQNISKINNEVKHRPAALAGSGQLFFFSEEPSKANRIVFQLVFSDSDESKLHYRRGMANSAGLQFEEWQSTSRSTEAASNFAISKVSPASIVGGSWIKNSSVPASMVWEHSGVSTYVDGQINGMNVLLNLETFALSASQEVYIKESGAFQKMTLGIGCGGTGSTTAEGARNALGAASQTDLNSLRDSVSRINRAQVVPFGGPWNSGVWKNDDTTLGCQFGFHSDATGHSIYLMVAKGSIAIMQKDKQGRDVWSNVFSAI